MKKRKDGLYNVQVYVGTREDGKREYKSFYGKTKKEAQFKADAFKVKMNKGVISDGSTVEFWARTWIAEKSVTVGNSQRENYERAVDRLIAALGTVPISEVRPVALQAIINDLYVLNPSTGSPASKRLLQLQTQTIKQIFRFALLNRAIDYNPADGLTVPSAAPAGQRRALTPEEIALVTDFPHPMRTGVLLMLYAGLRRGELLALTWDDVDLDAGTVTVNKSVEFVGEDPRVKTPKTAAGNRVVYIPAVLIDYLRPLQSSGLVFPHDGDIFKKTQFRHAWNAYLLDLDQHVSGVSKFHPARRGLVSVDRFTPHCLRHTFCTMLFEKGVDALTAQNQLGHADLKTTLGIYTHLSADHAREQMKKLNG